MYDIISIRQLAVNSETTVKINSLSMLPEFLQEAITEPTSAQAMLIPAKEDIKPLWVNVCNLIYNGDGTATLRTQHGQSTGRIGIDFIVCHGIKSDGHPEASILATYDESYRDYIIYDATGNEIGKLCDLYPA